MKKGTITNILLILTFFVGLSLLLYPTISDQYNRIGQRRHINDYAQEVAAIDNEVYDSYIQAARDYNATLPEKQNPFLMSDEEQEAYRSLLNISGTGIMGYIEIPSLKEVMPIYHGTEESVLQVGIGHLEWSSLPVGGEQTHCVLSGHRGLPSARLFTDLDKVAVGDIFLLNVLDEVLTYEVDQIRIVLPHEVQDLTFDPGEDLCTLVTCTPYGINSHRLLVRGHRIATQEAAKVIRVTADAMLVETHLVAIAVSIPMLLALLAVLLVTTRKKK